MQPFPQLTSAVIPLDRANVDTDQIIPKQFLKSIFRSGLGRGLFFDWRYLPGGALRPEFPLNQPRYHGARILLAGANFGCGSSREHAAWALRDFGIVCVLAPSFADIFYNNCAKNGMLAAALRPEEIEGLFALAARPQGLSLTVSLPGQTVSVADAGGAVYRFAIDPHRRKCLLQGLDDIALTLRHEEVIRAYEDRAGNEAVAAS